jgi:hypothetical protein
MKNFPNNLNDPNEYPCMVRWFSPIVLLKTVKKVVTSTIFGQYADRRLVHASLNLVDPKTVIDKCCGGEKGICGEKNEQPVWVDYVADLGDGFDSTYAIAYLIGQKEIQVSNDTKLPRADCLIMGGDQVYPDASREDYEKRMQRPYEAAFPRNDVEGSSPPVYLIPGNHDWYDGLTLFLAKFCRGSRTRLGNWMASQSRSYFAVHLAENWWIWGFDSQLGEDIDKPQADYFTSVAKEMKSNAKVILCASVPSWLKADTAANDEKDRHSYYKSLHYIANILREHCEGVKIPIVISGDLHHYSRYVAKESGTNFITAGGGGAFLHPTHHLRDKIETKWSGNNNQTLEIGQDAKNTKKAFYPPQDKSRSLALGNIWFVFKNYDFGYALGALYLISALLMLMWSGYGESGGTGVFFGLFYNQLGNLCSTPIFALLLLGFPFILIWAADIKSTTRKWVVAIIHALAHLTLMVVGTALLSVLVIGLKSVSYFGEILYFFVLSILVVLLGFIGAAIWGLYLTVACWLWKDETNNAFSAMRLDNYRHFIRLKIEADKITIYPVGIDKSPKREDWKINESYKKGTQDIPVIVPTKDLEQHLIEDPIVIDINDVIPLRV